MEAIVFVADGRFHLEAIMIANPAIPAYRWVFPVKHHDCHCLLLALWAAALLTVHSVPPYQEAQPILYPAEDQRIGERGSGVIDPGCHCRYDPYGRVLTREEYDQEGMRSVRKKSVQQARRAQQWGLVLGTLGRQGNPRILTHLQHLLASRGLPFTTVRSCCLPPSYLPFSNLQRNGASANGCSTDFTLD